MLFFQHSHCQCEQTKRRQETSVVSKKGQKSIVCRWKWTAAQLDSYKNNIGIGNDEISGLHHKKRRIEKKCFDRKLHSCFWKFNDITTKSHNNFPLLFGLFRLLSCSCFIQQIDFDNENIGNSLLSMTLRNEIIKYQFEIVFWLLTSVQLKSEVSKLSFC